MEHYLKAIKIGEKADQERKIQKDREYYQWLKKRHEAKLRLKLLKKQAELLQKVFGNMWL